MIKHEEQSSECLWRKYYCNLQFRGRSSPVVARTPRGPRNERCQVAEQSFGMFTIHIYAVVFELSSMVKEKKKKEDEQNRTFRASFS